MMRNRLFACVLATAVGPAAPADGLGQLCDRVAALESVSVDAEVRARFEGAWSSVVVCDEWIDGDFEYRSSGARWKMMSRMNPQGWPGMNTEAAYDGALLQCFRPDDGVLSISASGLDRSTGMQLPNPLVELVQFAFAENHEDAPVHRSLKEIGAAAADAATRRVEWTSPDADGMRRATIPGGSFEGEEYVFVIGASDDLSRPHWIERRLRSGSVVTRSTFEGYDVLAEGFPSRIFLEAFEPECGSRRGAIEYRVSSFFRDSLASLPEDEFTLDWGRAVAIWFDDPQHLLSPR